MKGIVKRRRGRLVVANGSISGLAQGVNFALSILLVPLIQRSYGLELLGVWFATTTVITFLGFADLGVGNAIISVAARVPKHERFHRFPQIAYAGSLLTIMLSLIVYVLLISIDQFDMWSHLLSFDHPRNDERLGPFFLYFALFIALSLPLSIVEKIQIADERAYVPRGLEALAGIIAIAICILVISNDGDLGSLFVARFLPITLLRLLNTYLFWLWTTRNPQRSTTVPITRDVGQLIRVGGSYFSISLAGAIALNSDTVLIAYMLGADRVPEYAVPFRLFTIPIILVGMFSHALWPAYAQALNEEELGWVRQTYKRTLATAVAMASVAISVLLIWGKDIITVWIGEPLTVHYGMLVAQALWAGIAVLGGIASPILNAAGEERFQAKLGVLLVFVNLPLSILLVLAMGPQGAMWGTVLSTIGVVTIPVHFRLFRLVFSARETRK